METEHLIQDLGMRLVGQSKITIDVGDAKQILNKINSLESAVAELLRLLNHERETSISRRVAI